MREKLSSSPPGADSESAPIKGRLAIRSLRLMCTARASPWSAERLCPVDADRAHVIDQAECTDVDSLQQPIFLVGQHQCVVTHLAYGVVDNHLPRGRGVPGDRRCQNKADAATAGHQQLPEARQAMVWQQRYEAGQHETHSIRHRSFCRRPMNFL